MSVQDVSFLTVPGWKGSGSLHWQTAWEQRYAMTRVEQHDWLRPLRGDWIAQLENTVIALNAPCILVAHSLGCMLVAAWAAFSSNTSKVKAVFQVAPADVGCVTLQSSIHGWSQVPLQTLPFKSMVVSSRNDPFCSFDTAKTFAHTWGADFVDAGYLGHINADTGIGAWPEGYRLLQQLIKENE